MSRDVILTREGLEKLSEELEVLKTEKRREVSARIKEAREFGDIAENAEFDDAKNEQAQIESRIIQLTERLRAATVVDHDDVSTDSVQVGNTVSVTDAGGKKLTFTIVGSAEADSRAGKLSNESPVGKALLGNKVGDTVNVTVPKGPPRELKITKIDIGI